MDGRSGTGKYRHLEGALRHCEPEFSPTNDFMWIFIQVTSTHQHDKFHISVIENN